MLIHSRLVLIKIILICAMGLNTAYASQETSITVTDTKIHTEKIDSNAGQINFSVKLKQNIEYSIIFSNKKTIKNTAHLIRFTTSDKGCAGEHQTSINFLESTKYFITQYFDKKISWNEDHRVTISWKDKNNFIFLLNDEKISIKTIKKPKYVHFVTTSPITLNNLSITQ